MPKKVALKSVVVVRDGQRIDVKPGTTFDFTAEELKQIEAASSPENVIVRNPVNEDPEGAAEVADTKPASKPAGKNATKGKADEL